MYSTPCAQQVANLATVQCRYKDDFVARLELVCVLPLELPVCVVDQDQDARSSVFETESLVSHILAQHTIYIRESRKISET
jgi:hypothetical protein